MNSKYNKLNLRLYVLILIFFILIIVYIFSDIKYYDYYLNNGVVVDDYIMEIYVLKDDLNIVQDNKKIQIKNKLFAYNIESISEPIFNEKYYYKVNIFVNITDDLNKKNNIIEFKILKDKRTILQYIFYKIGGI